LGQLGHRAGKYFYRTDKEFYSHLVENYKDAVLYMSVDDRKMTVAQDQTGYTICRIINGDKDYKEIIKAEYYEHMSIMVENLIDQYMLKLYSLEATFLTTIDNELLSTNYLLPVSEICSFIKKASFSHCVGMSVQTDNDWNEFFTSFKDRYLDIDNALIKLTNIFAKECSMSANLNRDFVYKYYEHFVPMLRKLSKLRHTYDTDLKEEFNRLIFRDRISPAEAMSCTHQFAKLHLSTKESIRQLLLIYNIKIDFLSEF
jgi:hypothetical protein